MARPWTRLPPGARDALEAMAATSGLKESTAAAALGMPLREFRRVIRKHEESREIWEDALSVERDALLSRMWNKAQEGDVNATKFLLSARHGMSEQRPEKAERGVHITFQLPAAMDPAKYIEAIQPAALPEPDA